DAPPGSDDVAMFVAPSVVVEAAAYADVSEAILEGGREVPLRRDDQVELRVHEPDLPVADGAGETFLEVVGALVEGECRCRPSLRRDEVQLVIDEHLSDPVVAESDVGQRQGFAPNDDAAVGRAVRTG